MNPETLESSTFPWVEELRQARKNKVVGGTILFYGRVGSTNLQAREHAFEKGEEGLVVMAESQSEGKGRVGRTWESPAGVNLYFSVLLRPPIAPAAAAQIPLFAGVALANSLSRATGLEARIKWPNDVFIHGKKVAGILSEMEAAGSKVRFVILGTGVNVNWQKRDFPLDLLETATSLREEAGRELSRPLIAAAIFEELEREYALFLEQGFSPRLREEWNRLSWINQKRVMVTVMNQQSEGWVLGLDRDGALLLEDDEGKIQRLIAGDISLRL